MYTLIVILHIVVSVTMILVILLQTGKGADIGAVFGGGGGQTMFGASGPTSFLGKMTAAAAIIFMCTSLFLAYFSGGKPSSSIMKGSEIPAMPSQAVPTAPPPGIPQGLPGTPQSVPTPTPAPHSAPGK
jgi:preprotein translocase subunit SecG